MLPRIKQLPLELANQIAAGEVIERPASVVKELLENAYDAKASAITLEIGHGGLNLIRISDNGCGIVADDLPMAVAAHATSKIEKLDDLYAISSMGFRGEALASIASVSKLTISSRTADAPHGTQLKVLPQGLECFPCARSQGTTLEVLDLFYNAPVRKKFLKGEKLEFFAIDQVVRRFAMSAPSIALTLKHNEKTVLALPPALDEVSFMQRLTKLFGKEFFQDAVAIDVSCSNMQLKGWLSGPGYQRSQNDRLWVYLNQRMVKDKLLQHAIKQSYDSLLHPGRHPACLLYLNLDTAEVDVNVHPTKHEVRFQEPRLVHDFITSQLTEALGNKLETVFTEPVYPKLQIQEKAKVSPWIQDSGQWKMLNSRYGLLFVAHEVWVVDVVSLYQEWLRQEFSRQELPLVSRPLLVPIQLEMESQNLKAREKSLEILGFKFQWLSDSAFKVQSLPLLFHQLNIREFLAKTTHENLSEALIQATQVDAQQLSSEEKLALADFAKVSKSQFKRALNPNLCESLFK